MKIFGIGLHRTGTRTLTTMLERLGWKVTHYLHWPETVQAYRTNYYDLRFLEEYDGATDLPIPIMFKQLDKAYPGSKFVFTDRELEPWLRSCERHCEYLDMDQPDLITHELVFGAREFDREKWTETYYRHQRRVREYFHGSGAATMISIHVENDLAGKEDQVLSRLEKFVGTKIE